MRRTITALAALALVLPAPAAAQELEVTRRSFNFLERWLDIAVVADAPGVLQVVRGARGKVEVAARAEQGFAGYGLGGELTRRLDLTAVGAQNAQFIVVVPEHVSVRIFMPDGTSATVQSRETGASVRWLAPALAPGANAPGRIDSSPIGSGTPHYDGFGGPEPSFVPAPAAEVVPPGMVVAHRTAWLPSRVDIPELASVRSLDIRFEGSDFRVAASRPLLVEPGDRSRFELRLVGDPLDVVLYVPASADGFGIHAGGVPIVESRAGAVTALCEGVVIQRSEAGRTWLSYRPADGRLQCRQTD
jgi:hypothetical protein